MAKNTRGRFTGRTLTKEDVINGLCDGLSLGEISRRFGYKSTSQIYSLRKRDEQFDEDVKRLLESPQHRKRIKLAQSATEEKTGGWQDRYLAYWRSNHDRGNAALYAGKEVHEVAEALDPNSDEYDEVFASRVKNEEIRIAWKIEDDVKIKALDGDSNMQKFVLSGGNGNRAIVDHVHHFQFSDEGEARAVGYLANKFRPVIEVDSESTAVD